MNAIWFFVALGSNQKRERERVMFRDCFIWVIWEGEMSDACHEGDISYTICTANQSLGRGVCVKVEDDTNERTHAYLPHRELRWYWRQRISLLYSLGPYSQPFPILYSCHWNHYSRSCPDFPCALIFLCLAIGILHRHLYCHPTLLLRWWSYPWHVRNECLVAPVLWQTDVTQLDVLAQHQHFHHSIRCWWQRLHHCFMYIYFLCICFLLH